MLRTLSLAVLALTLAACDSGGDGPGGTATPGRYVGASSAAGPTTTVAFATDGPLRSGTESVATEITIGFSSDPYEGTGSGTAEVDGDRVTLDLSATGTYQGEPCRVSYSGTGTLSADGRTVSAPAGRLTTCFFGQAPPESFTFVFAPDAEQRQ